MSVGCGVCGACVSGVCVCGVCVWGGMGWLFVRVSLSFTILLL